MQRRSELMAPRSLPADQHADLILAHLTSVTSWKTKKEQSGNANVAVAWRLSRGEKTCAPWMDCSSRAGDPVTQRLPQFGSPFIKSDSSRTGNTRRSQQRWVCIWPGQIRGGLRGIRGWQILTTLEGFHRLDTLGTPDRRWLGA